jgi:hypothetical protein
MKYPRKPISELPHKWRRATTGSKDFIIIDRHNSNFNESEGRYNDACTVQYTARGQQIVYDHTIYEITTED